MSATARQRGTKRRDPIVTVVGGGSSAQTMAADLALRGFAVRLCDLPHFSSNIELLLETKQIEKHGAAEARGPVGLAHLQDVTTDVGDGIRGADVVLIAVPAYAHTAMGPGKVRVIAESGVVRIAAIPSTDTPTVLEVSRKLSGVGTCKRSPSDASGTRPYGTSSERYR